MTPKTLHKDDCQRVFKRYDKACPRCQELINGAPARGPWFMPQTQNTPKFSYCEHVKSNTSNMNPGGYCNVCGSGRDHS